MSIFIKCNDSRHFKGYKLNLFDEKYMIILSFLIKFGIILSQAFLSPISQKNLDNTTCYYFYVFMKL
jgi:hypothetical protein